MSQSLSEILPLLLPVVALQLGLIALGLYDLARRQHVRFGNKALWGVVILIFSIVGPLTYFALGREEA